MDDDIDIEEHDILEHPLVKAVFPDLSKIEIQVHTGAFDATLLHKEENSNLLEEIPDNTEKRAKYENGEKNLIEDDFDYDPKNAPQDNLDDGQMDSDNNEGNVNNSNKHPSDYNKNHRVDIVHEISDDEPMPEVTEVASEIQPNDNQYIVDFKSYKSVDNVNVVEISDDEEKPSGIYEDYRNGDGEAKSDENIEAIKNVKAITMVKITEDNETQKNGDDIYAVDNNSNTEKIFDKIEVSLVDDKNVGTKDILARESEENREAIINGQNGLIGNLITETEKYLLESEKTMVEDEKVIYENIHKTNEESMVDIQNGPDDMFDEDENRHKKVKDNADFRDNGQSEVDEMNTEICKTTYLDPEVPIKQEIEDVPIKEEIIDDFETEEYNFDESVSEIGTNFNETPNTPDKSTDFIPNKIILGTKPSPTIISYVKNYSYLVVRLEDWGKHLNQSPCYCRLCKILFTTPNALDYHNMSAHSLLAPITNRAIKSTAKSSKPKNIAKKSTSAIDLDKSTHCSHCNVNFKDNTALIKHLYELLPQQYNCNICNKTFNSQNELTNHNTVHVKIEPRKILKAKKNLDNPMLRRLLSQETKIPVKSKYIQSSVTKVPVKIKAEPVDDSGFRFKCMVCSDIFNNYGSARKHRETHPDKKHQMIFKKIVTVSRLKRTKDKLIFEDEKPTKKLKFTKDPFTSQSSDPKTNGGKIEMVPKSALFQCPKCSLHFTSTISGLSHISGNNCDTKSSKWTCPTCKKRMRSIDMPIHKRQHQLSSKFRIYKITKTTNERTLCKCLKCNVHFEYILLRLHLKTCGKIPTAKCVKCNIILPKDKVPRHMMKHDILKLKPKDFIFVEYVIASDIRKKFKQGKSTPKSSVPTSSGVDIRKPLTVKTKPGVVLTQKILKIERSEKLGTKKYKMFFCKHCKISLTSIRKLQSHLNKQCIANSRNKYVCNKCGLYLPCKTKQLHIRLHHQKKFSLNDVQFFDIVTKKPIALPMMKYPACPTCKIHFLTKIQRRRHICGEDYENCEYCGEMYEISTLKTHMEFHRVQKLNEKPKTEKCKPETSKSVIPELMMRYESLNPIWNILFLCSKCELVTDLYNKAVEHSQNHLRKDYKQPKSINCYICNLLFEETCWVKHKGLHTQMPIKRKAFHILTYTPENLLEESWFQMFESVPEKAIRQIIDQSVFGGERSLKMKLIKYGLPEFTLYCCSDCQVCYDTNNLRAHVNVRCKGSKFRCAECEILFENETTLTFHRLLHERGIKKEEFRIIHFIKTPQSFKTNEKDYAELSKAQDDLMLSNIDENVDPRALDVLMTVRERVRNDEIDFEKPVELNPRAKFCLYRCVRCSACIHLRIHRNKHKCAPAYELYFCKICKQNFHVRRKGYHMAEHESKPNFKPKNTNIFEFDLEDQIQMQRRKKYTKTAIKPKKNKKIISSKAKPSKVSKKEIANKSKPSKVKRRNSVESFQNFVYTVTSDVKTKESNSELNSTQESKIQQGNRKSFKIYKCDCGLHYTSLKTIDKHMETCNNGVDISTDNCSKCGLLFPTEILVTHLCKHHSLANIEPDITIEEVKKNKKTREIDVITKEVTKNKNNDSKIDTSTEEVKDKKNSRDYIKIYKCGECQVHYLNQNTCYKHAYKNHVKLDPKKFIDCKVCGLAFTLASLQIHIRKHHETELNLDKVLIEEYRPTVGKGAPKIDIYFASQKVQNVQVSSSND